jgi:hypothetical protein
MDFHRRTFSTLRDDPQRWWVMPSSYLGYPPPRDFGEREKARNRAKKYASAKEPVFGGMH